MALYDVLESHGLEVNVANARHTKTLPGRKTDVQECQWLQKLHTFGLLNNSFPPNRGDSHASRLPTTTGKSGGGSCDLYPAYAKSSDRDEHPTGQRN